jgi:hypothetical protein
MFLREITMRNRAYCLGLVLIVCCVQIGSAEDPPAPATPPVAEKPKGHVDHHADTLTAEEVRHRLLDSLTFTCDHASLSEVLKNQIAAPSKLDIYIDTESIEKASIAFDELTATGQFKNATIRAILTRILAANKLAYFCDDTGVCVTTQEAHDQHFMARVYDVTELVPANEVGHPATYQPGYQPQPFHNGNSARTDELSPPPFTPSSGSNENPLDAPKQTPAKPVQFGGGMPVRIVEEFPDGMGWNHSQNANAWVLSIQAATGGNVTDAWSQSGKSGTISIMNTGHAKLMVVRQTEAVHTEIESLLAEIYTHHHMTKPDESNEQAKPHTAKLKIVRPQLRAVNLGNR